MSNEQSESLLFSELNLSNSVLKALTDVGYKTPSPIQAATIPHLVEGKDILGQAQTGTGKTAAFALPALTKIDLNKKLPQVLVLAPTRELAIQVAEAFNRYGAHMKGLNVLSIYGGAPYGDQLRQLKRGTHVVVGTPGRVMDHMRRGSLDLSELTTLILDEADEMLRMGFIDDVEWILEQTPEERQTALFSATMPKQVRRIAEKHLNDPVQITIKSETSTASTIRQRFWMVYGFQAKTDAVARLLEAEESDGVIIFVRTKAATVELSEKLEARGFRSVALNGDIPQNNRERIVERFKAGKLDILVATDVVARGLDVERVSHVINYDIPFDTESYVHRIGRTGRAGRSGEAVLFVGPRERRMLKNIEKATKQKIEEMQAPSADMINKRRVDSFKERINAALESEELSTFRGLIEEYVKENDSSEIEVAAALAKMAQGDKPLLLKDRPKRERSEKTAKEPREGSKRGDSFDIEKGKERYRIEVGKDHDVKPANIVGAIANEAGLDSKNIGQIQIFSNFSTVDLPEGMPKEIFRALRRTWVSGQLLKIRKATDSASSEKRFDKGSKRPAGRKPRHTNKRSFAGKGRAKSRATRSN